MPKKNNNITSFVDSFMTEKHTKNELLEVVTAFIDWNEVRKILNKYYKKGKSVTGRPAYCSLVLFKMTLLQTWYNLSDIRVEQFVNQTIPFRYFCGLGLVDDVPDHTAIARFREILAKTPALELLLKIINKQLETQGLQVKEGYTVDASITKSLRKPGYNPKYALSEDTTMQEEKQEKNMTKTSTSDMVKKSSDKCQNQFKQATQKLVKCVDEKVDREAYWTKKNSQFQYGYKTHVITDTATTLVKAVATTPANVHDSKLLKQLLKQVNPPPNTPIYADKAYYSQKTEKMLAQCQLKSRILVRATPSNALKKRTKKRNKLISKKRCQIERVFAGIKQWFKSGICRYVGLEKTHWQHTIEVISYNLKLILGFVKNNKLTMG